MKKNKIPMPKFKEGEFFTVKKNEFLYSILEAQYFTDKDVKHGNARQVGWLYTMVAPNLAEEHDQKYKRYYEDKMQSDAQSIVGQDTARILYK